MNTFLFYNLFLFHFNLFSYQHDLIDVVMKNFYGYFPVMCFLREYILRDGVTILSNSLQICTRYAFCEEWVLYLIPVK